MKSILGREDSEVEDTVEIVDAVADDDEDSGGNTKFVGDWKELKLISAKDVPRPIPSCCISAGFSSGNANAGGQDFESESSEMELSLYA